MDYPGDLDAEVFYSRCLLLPAYRGALFHALTSGGVQTTAGDETIGGAPADNDPDNLNVRRRLLAELRRDPTEPMQWVDHETLIREATV